MSNPRSVEARLTTLEARVEIVAQDAAAARHLAAAHDHDISDLAVKVDANRAAINALGVQTAHRFDLVDQRFDRLEKEMRDGFAASAAGFRQIAELVTQAMAKEDK